MIPFTISTCWGCVIVKTVFFHSLHTGFEDIYICMNICVVKKRPLRIPFFLSVFGEKWLFHDSLTFYSFWFYSSWKWYLCDIICGCFVRYYFPIVFSLHLYHNKLDLFFCCLMNYYFSLLNSPLRIILIAFSDTCVSIIVFLIETIFFPDSSLLKETFDQSVMLCQFVSLK